MLWKEKNNLKEAGTPYSELCPQVTVPWERWVCFALSQSQLHMPLRLYFPAAIVIWGHERESFFVFFFNTVASKCILTASVGIHLKKHQPIPELGGKWLEWTYVKLYLLNYTNNLKDLQGLI